MTLQLVTTMTADGVELDGALYVPATAVRRSGVLVLHGLTWNFYRGPSRWLPPLLAHAGHTCLALNMRDHDLKEPGDFDRAHHDIRAGIDLLEGRGLGEVVLLAHGFACNKLACYAAQSGDRTPRWYVLTTLGAVHAYRPELWQSVLQSAGELSGKVLVVQGAADTLIDAQARADELVAAASATTAEVVLLERADHYFNDRHGELSDCVLRWLTPA